MVPAPMEEFKDLDGERSRLEEKISALQEYLNGPGMPGVSGPLVDDEGFPRADLDLYAIRRTRQELACAQTDHVEIMKKLEVLIQSIHSGSRVDVPRQKPAATAAKMDDDGQPQAEVDLHMSTPFALIDEVSEGSPAHEAGLLVNDLLCIFGGVSTRDTGDLKACFAALPAVVQGNVGKPVEVQALRGTPPKRVTLQLTPKQWAGRGLLGCHLAPHVGS
eukprot:TRINITY_DN124124_c0_g1_i1.p1 TRINITY_DN124124_c0_g1~~TRINITY_DN124124_c0_g1_i1.p1  ORF type:complete len:241 (-),score=34.64 TRINITY_DN124124_c0_g1_i1:318-974(-)